MARATGTPPPVVGDEYQDKYGGPNNPRVIRVVEVYPNGIRAEILRGMDGKKPDPARFTKVMLSTLKSGYRRMERE